MGISAPEYQNIFKDFDWNFVWKYAEEYYWSDMRYCSKRVENVQTSFNIYRSAADMIRFGQKLRAVHMEINQAQNLQLRDNKPQLLITAVLWTNLTTKAQLTNRFSETPKQKFIHFWNSETLNTVMRNFHSEFMSSYWNQMKCILTHFFRELKLPFIYSSEEFLQNIIPSLLKYLIDSNLSTVLPQMRTLSALLLIIQTNNFSVERGFLYSEEGPHGVNKFKYALLL
jgi:hypothetical protein